MDPDGHRLREVLEYLAGLIADERAAPEFGAGRRWAVGEKLKSVAKIIREEQATLLPTLKEARDQMQKAVDALVHAANAVKAARTALQNLDDDGFEGLFGGCEFRPSVGSKDSAVECDLTFGDEDAPLGKHDYDRFCADLDRMAKLIDMAHRHAMRTREEARLRLAHDYAAPRMPEPIRAGHPILVEEHHFQKRRHPGRNQDVWKFNAVLSVIGVFEELGLHHLVQETQTGPLHTVTNMIVQGLAGLEKGVGSTAFLRSVASYKSTLVIPRKQRRQRATLP